jgi:CRISPR-associated protein Cmr3
MMHLLITPLGATAFKWGGVSSILISGSVNTGYFEPLPLPSTIYGFLKYAYIINKLGEDAPIFRGPLFYAKGEKKELVCVHYYPLGLVCNINGSICSFKIKEEHFEHKIGIALHRDSKLTKEGYIYLEKMLNMVDIAKKILGEYPKQYGILIEVNDENSKKLDNFVGPFGGESRPAKINLIELNINKIGKRILASPAIIDKGDDLSVHWGNESAKIKIVSDLIPYSDNLIHQRATIGQKITYRLISLGFELNKRLPMKLALMPTVEILDDEKAIGYFTEKGWGSVVDI